MNLGFLWLDVKVEKNKPISLLTLSPLYPKTNFHTALRYFFRLYFISLQFFFFTKTNDSAGSADSGGSTSSSGSGGSAVC